MASYIPPAALADETSITAVGGVLSVLNKAAIYLESQFSGQLVTAGHFLAPVGLQAVGGASHAAVGLLIPDACRLVGVYVDCEVAVEAGDTVTAEVFLDGVTTGLVASVVAAATAGQATNAGIAVAAGKWLSLFLDTAPTSQAVGNFYRITVVLLRGAT